MEPVAGAPEAEDPCEATNLDPAHVAALRAAVAAAAAPSAPAAEAAAAHTRLARVLAHYQEQPQLLDPVLAELVAPLAAVLLALVPADVAAGGGAAARLRAAARPLWALASTRGAKTVLRLLPNEVAALEPALDLLDALDAAEAAARAGAGGGGGGGGAGIAPIDDGEDGWWEARCALLMWLRLLVLVPFDFAVVDSALDGGAAGAAAAAARGYPPLAGRALGACRRHLATPGAPREQAAAVLGRLLTRPDMAAALEEFVAWAAGVLAEADAPAGADPAAAFRLPGAAAALAAALKLGARGAVAGAAAAALPAGAALLRSRAAARSSLLRRLAVKLVTRAALAFLPTRVAAWRYDRGARSLAPAGAAAAAGLPAAPADAAAAAADTDADAGGWAAGPAAAAAAEAAAEALLEALADRDTVVRWAAAKGVGRLAARLPPALAGEVVASVLASLDPAAGDAAWHGGCLALAELARRGLLAGGALAGAAAAAERALAYDVRRGPCSVGAHVRDAAAYACWALARAAPPAALAAAAARLAPALVAAAVYDREVNCRRAAAAAFQECVGRLGAFPSGIEIIGIADYFSVAARPAAYLDVAPRVAVLPGYLEPLARHLLERKVAHWERATRELAARALAALAPLDPGFFVAEALPALLPAAAAPGLEARHGAVAALAELLPALAAAGAALPPAAAAAAAGVVPAIEAGGLARGKGGEVMRGAVCHLVRALAATGLPLSPAQCGAALAAALEGLRHAAADVQAAAAAAIAAHAERNLRCGGEAATAAAALVARLAADVRGGGAGRRGAALALGALPGWLLAAHTQAALAALAAAAAPPLGDATGAADPEARAAAAGALAAAALALLADPNGAGATEELLDSLVLDPLLAATDDYATDNRGDVGSWAREAAVGALADVLCALGPERAPPAAAERALLAAARLAAERIGRLRAAAGAAAQRLAPLAAGAGVAAAGPVGAALASLSREAFESAAALPTLTALLAAPAPAGGPALREALVEGLAFSLGGLDAQLAAAAGDALAAALRPLGASPAALAAGPAPLLAVWRRRRAGREGGRLAVPMLAATEALLSHPELGDALRDAPGGAALHADLTAAAAAEAAGCADVPRLRAASGALAALAAAGPPAGRRAALAAAAALLGVRFPRARHSAAEQLYTALLAWEPLEDGGEEEEPDAEAAMALLGETAWDGPATAVRPARLAVCAALRVPAELAAAPGGEARSKHHAPAAYRSLVEAAARGL
jgi:hypothetical protein